MFNYGQIWKAVLIWDRKSIDLGQRSTRGQIRQIWHMPNFKGQRSTSYALVERGDQYL